MSEWCIGVIGGSGLYVLDQLEDPQVHAIGTPWGATSGPVTTGRIGGVRFAFLPRHGPGHPLPPEAVPYRANIAAMKQLGVTDLIAISAIGSLREELAPGDFVAVDQFIDRTHARPQSFFASGLVAHVPFGDPVCPRLSGLAAAAAREAGVKVHEHVCYLAMQGPQFSTRAESRMYRQWGADVIGMTGIPEAKLAREAELPYALLGMVTDYDSWREGESVDVAEILHVMSANAGKARAAVERLAGYLPSERSSSPIDTALDTAIVTAPSARDPALAARIEALIGRELG
ncbi:MAG: S-methyl-5'-thioadenosine phosphorylase [Sphingomonadales bacterium]|nr:S-methyl-5'-thioadenosine phosphorylase [Sphingomonadales bacterium]MDE2567638.1 S-methyl-5'-thioadenosine phosphorylase [Sphingomonadales bacterium]